MSQQNFEFLFRFYFIMTFHVSNFNALNALVTVTENCVLSHHFCYCSKMNTPFLKFEITNENSFESGLNEFQGLYLWRTACNLYREDKEVFLPEG